MKRVSQNTEIYFLCLQKFQHLPKILMQYRVATCKVKIRNTVKFSAKVKTIIKDCPYILKRHFRYDASDPPGKNIAMLTSLVALFCDMPLKWKVLFHCVVFLMEKRFHAAPQRRNNGMERKRQLLVSYSLSYHKLMLVVQL